MEPAREADSDDSNERNRIDEWIDFLQVADQWFVAYAATPALNAVTLFSIGHFLELYLKGTSAKQTADMQRTINFGHRIKDIWDNCKLHDPLFLPDYEIRESVFNCDFTHSGFASLPERNQKHLFLNFELYLIAKYHTDSKYLGTLLKQLRPQYQYVYTHPNDYWISMFKKMRGYLGYPPANRRDVIRAVIDEPDHYDLTPNARSWLAQVFQ